MTARSTGVFSEGLNTRGLRSVETVIPLCCDNWMPLYGVAIAKASDTTESSAKAKAINLVVSTAELSISRAIDDSTCPGNCRHKEVRNKIIKKPQVKIAKDCKTRYAAVAMVDWKASIRCEQGPGIHVDPGGGHGGVTRVRGKKPSRKRTK